jgi:predicted alpha/beta hydrolase family esterase
MKTAIILHGTLGDSKGNWFQWLKAHLEQKGVKVWAPDLPNPESPSLNEWSEFVITNCPFGINQDTALIGHSAGAVAVLTVAQKLDKKIERVVSVSVFKDNDFLKWEPNNRLFDAGFNFKKMKENCANFLFVHSDDDPYCPLEHAEYLAQNTGGKLEVIPGQGHFNLEKSSSYKEFPKLLEYLQ